MPYTQEPIAVIGSGCRFPGSASNPSKLWDLLRDPKDVQRSIDRFRADNFYNKDGHYHGASNVLSAYLLAEDPRTFDSQFFSIPLSEAAAIDPQQRLLMETVYESLEAAGISMESLSGSNTAVYVGVMCDDFSQIVYGDSENIPTYAATGSARSILSNRISYFFNWHGPSMTIDTACSSSLVAVHQAVQALRSGESPVAIASGTNLIFGPTMFVAESNLNMLSPTGRSRMWDAGANGYARGEGVASIVMKTLSAALRDGDDIEYIIRETGVNQDGKTAGITMPSSEWQAKLIRDTYAKAGLDPLHRDDRCQYFEAHGTGTPAGDPQEAGAIHKAFFAQRPESANDDESEDVLVVGSVKTIIGHTEGTAGIAGLMKAALAIQNGSIPPNMHFTRLNPDIKPYYGNLKIPIHLRDWPELAEGVPRRASVNSFGFGGANAHAITRAPTKSPIIESSCQPSTPHVFVFSAASTKALTAQLRSYLSFLDKHPSFDMDTLSWSLFRRTAHAFRVAITAKSIESLRVQITEILGQNESSKVALGFRVSPKTPHRIMGIFTGQGAQWATMGRELILSSHFARSVIENLERSLSELPAGDAPDWSLMAELLAPKESSRISEGVISQPLCTAIQIMLVDFLHQAGIGFSCVVGHSSGEIACAYVSGFLSASDAIRIAYYRGKYTPLAQSRAGGMIAVGTNMQDAVDMCRLPKLKGRAQLAASNSPASVTISGDADAIDLVEVVAKDESKFARKLLVDTAYHSFHMEACSVPYLESLRKCGINIMEPSVGACPWYTSVSATNEKVTMSKASALAGPYWNENLLSPVLFSQALDAAISAEGDPGLVLEVGPNPALKGPASTCIEECVGHAVPYFGTLSRGQDDSTSLLAALGSVWCVLGASGIPNMRDLQVAYSKDTKFQVSKDLPTYSWEHDRVVWNETRVSKRHRHRPDEKHELLGICETSEGEGERRWRNYLKPREMSWLTGHQIQGQMVFPAAAYAVMALEAARTLVPDEGIRLMQLRNFSIHKAISFMDDNASIETLFCLSAISHSGPDHKSEMWLSADFACFACINKEIGDLTRMATGTIKLDISESEEIAADEVLPLRQKWVNNFVDVDVEYFYECLAELGYGYTSMFQGIADLQRTNDGSKGTIVIPYSEDEKHSTSREWVIHPATLDVAFQAVFAAVGAPGDGRLWTMHVPTTIDNISIDPRALATSRSGKSGVGTPLPFDAFVVESDRQEGIAGDVDLHDEQGRRVIVQIEGLHVTPLAQANAEDDRETFASVSWNLATPDLLRGWSAWPEEESDEKLAQFAERLSLCILRDTCDTASAADIEHNGTQHQRDIIKWAQHVVSTIQWLADDWRSLEYFGRLTPQNDQELSWLSENFYNIIPGFHKYLDYLASLVSQIAFKHRNMRLLEIGVGRGRSTSTILNTLGQNITSYTCADAGTSDFDHIQTQVPAEQVDRVNFKTLDLERSLTEQGFVAGQYDLVIASNTLKQIRTLPTNSASLAIALCGCVSYTWHSAVEETRRYSPFLNQGQWDELLRTTGFSGLDTATPEEPAFSVPYSVMCSMAIDKQMAVLRDPLALASRSSLDTELLIIGGRTAHTRQLVRDTKNVLEPFFQSVHDMLAKKPATISLSDLDEPLFNPFTEDNLRTMLWITVGSRGENPYMNMMVAVGRCLFLNFDGNDRPLHLSGSMSGESKKPNEPLYLFEREMTIQDGTLLLPRYLPVEPVNMRLNSDKRIITQKIDQYCLRENRVSSSEREDSVRISVQKSLLTAIRVGSVGYLHLMLGKPISDPSKRIVAFSSVNQSILQTPRSQLVEMKSSIPRAHEGRLLNGIAAELLADAILAQTSGAVLVHGPFPGLAKSLRALATRKGVVLVLTSSSVSPAVGYTDAIHPGTPARVLARYIPEGLTVFVDLSVGDKIGSQLRNLVPHGSEIRDASQLFRTNAFGNSTNTAATNALRAATDRATMSVQQTESVETLPASAVPSLRPLDTIRQIQVVDWTADTTLPAIIRPADESMRFRNDRTYFLVGLAGELGLQLTKWMVKHGARYLALASRNPQVDPDWLQLVQSQGAVVKAYPMDVTTRSSVRATHQRLCAEMPPVAGVMNGAMILLDGLFANKTHAEFEKTLRPKVDGTVFLDEVFNNRDLDFFVVFSSLAAVSGNMGQTAYAAANAFMCSLVAGRRMRGLAGSSINMPGIVGLGYLNRDSRKLHRLKNLGYVNISEWDFYQFLSEAIAAGRPDSGMIPEITAGLKKLQIEGHPDPPLWAKTPRFHWLREPVSTTADSNADGAGSGGSMSIRSRLAGVTNQDELRTTLLDGLLGTLYSRLNMSPEEQGITPDTAIVELGVDSLLAVDMRSWFTKELDLDMPVLKILGGATVYDLVADAMSRIAPELAPNLAGNKVDDPAVPDNEQETSGHREGETAGVENDFAAQDHTIAEGQDEEEQEPVVMVPVDLPDWIEYESTDSDDDLSTTQEDLDTSDEQSDNTSLPTSDSELSLGDAKDEPNPPSVIAKAEHHPTAQLFSRFQESEGPPQFVTKVPMSYGTSRFWFLRQYLRDHTTFNLLCQVKFTGDLRFDDAERTIAELGNRHEIFRTCFFADPEDMNQPTLGVMEKSHLRLERRAAVSEADVDAEGDELMKYDFKIEQGETIRMKMVSLPNSTHHLLFGFHHIILDGFSFNLILAELNPIYDHQALEPVKMPFSEFAIRQRKQVEDGHMDDHFQYWKDIFTARSPSGDTHADFPEPLPLFNLAQSTRKSLDVYEFHESALVLDARTNRQIKAHCRRHKITPFHFFLAVLRIFLGRHLDVDDLVIGIADANRVDSSVDSTVGFMLNLLPLRFRGNGNKKENFNEVAQATRDTVYEALAHSALPFDALLERLAVPRSASHSPLFQVWMDYRPIKPGNRPTLFGSEANGTQTVGRNGYDLTLDITELDDSEPRISFRTQKYLYSSRATKMLFESYMRLVTAFAANISAPTDSTPLWNPADIESAKTLGQGPRLEREWQETVSHRIAHIADESPGHTAAKDDSGSSITYAMLQQRVQCISSALSKVGVKERSRVAVFQEPTVDWICSLLAIWHAGATYVPLDLRITESMSRLAIIAHAAKPSAILCHDTTKRLVPELDSPAVVINVSSIGCEQGVTITDTKAKSSTIAAILFTSGSTGVPKGVCIPHRALQNTFEGLTRQYGIGSEKVLQQSAFTFDFSLDQILVALCNTGSVHVVSKENRTNAVAIANIIRTEGVTYTRATPSEYASWLAHGADRLRQAESWKFAWAGGEVLPPSLLPGLGRLELPKLRLFNSYGPAESVTCTKTEVPFGSDRLDEDGHNDATAQEASGAEMAIIPVGFPLPNYCVFIVDHNLELLPQGASGEIVIGGPSVADGYINHEKLGESKFIGNDYTNDGRIVYRTGDVGQLQSDGSLVFLGRIAGDTMVKLRGQRVDLQEIENSIVMAAEGAIEKAVVSIRSNQTLVAHVQFSKEDQVDEDDEDDDDDDNEALQKAFLRQLRFVLPLPLFMIPSLFVPLAEMPTNAHGKTDRNAVSQLALPQASAGKESRAEDKLTDTETKLLQIWKEVVTHPEAETKSKDVVSAIEVTSMTTFFELGGNSLLLVKLQMLISIRFNVKVSLMDLLGALSLGAMAAAVEAGSAADVVDWVQETQLQANELEDLAAIQDVSSKQPRNGRALRVLITGATGFLGRSLMRALVDSDKVSEVHSVAVRSEQQATSKDDKVHVYRGDLSEPCLGLSEADFDNLSSAVDVIIHAGAARSVSDTYPQLRGANFESTKTLVHLAARQQIQIHFISSGSVATLGDTPPENGAQGYAAAKWASERYLGHAADALKLPVTVHRITSNDNISADASRQQEFVGHIRALATEMGCAPAAGDKALMSLDLIRVGPLAERIAREAMSERGSVTLGGLEHRRYCSELRVAVEDIVPRDLDLPTVPAVEWIARARRSGFGWQLVSLDNFPFRG
ncbi:hypothetical protein F4778DRAFT_803016 [Xylariomycetidae sp. FL2044]|nr:hypothetical protein F4778DRAFT_803016 [Xylariomycetidae sp. FL2044]